jgi:hypothetical protein
MSPVLARFTRMLGSAALMAALAGRDDVAFGRLTTAAPPGATTLAGVNLWKQAGKIISNYRWPSVTNCLY